MTCNKVPERAGQRHKGGHDRDEPPLQPARSADATQPPHEQSKIEAGRVDQQSLPNVRVPAEIHTAQPTRLVEIREGSFQTLAAEAQ